MQDSLQIPLTLPLMGGANPNAVGALIGFGFILMLPSVLNTVKQVFKTPKLNFGNLFSPVGAAVSYPRNIAMSTGSIMAGRKEAVMKEVGPNKYDWGKRGTVGSIKGRLFR